MTRFRLRCCFDAPNSPLAARRKAGVTTMPRTRSKQDFDLEAERLFEQLKHDDDIVVHELDAIWKHPKGGSIFVGNGDAASDLELLTRKRITHVVNCTDSMPNYHQYTSDIKYYRFDIASWQGEVDDTHESVRRFVSPVLDFVGQALGSGASVLVHCLAGAHRAGTTGCLCLMHFAGMNPQEAIRAARARRPLVDPIGRLPALLDRFQAAAAAAEDDDADASDRAEGAAAATPGVIAVGEKPQDDRSAAVAASGGGGGRGARLSPSEMA